MRPGNSDVAIQRLCLPLLLALAVSPLVLMPQGDKVCQGDDHDMDTSADHLAQPVDGPQDVEMSDATSPLFPGPSQRPRHTVSNKRRQAPSRSESPHEMLPAPKRTRKVVVRSSGGTRVLERGKLPKEIHQVIHITKEYVSLRTNLSSIDI